MNCLAILGPFSFASGAEEKVSRIFTAPRTFKNYLGQKDELENEVADSASVPALGLTNKAVFRGENNVSEECLHVGSASHLDYERPPLEEELIQHTLWPELQKLYGHGYEVFAMAATSDGAFLATACKSTSAEHAAIILWNAQTWTRVMTIIIIIYVITY